MPSVPYHVGGFPPRALDWERLVPFIGPAAAAVARYEGMLMGIPNADVLLAPLTTQEAVLSSRIEGTQATMGEVLEYEATGSRADISREKTADIQEVLNYRSALRQATADMAELPLSQRVLTSAHRVLMAGVRGAGKSPGQYRRTPFWIGSEGASIEAARFVPINAADIPHALSEWDRYLHSDAPDVLVQLAVLHAEFEAIHPFLDGNGRLGRLLVPLFLVEKKVLARPNFYISGFLEERRDEYYARLLEVSRSNDWTGWCIFFLIAIRSQAEINEAKIRSILELYRSEKAWIAEAIRSRHALPALEWIFGRPIFATTDFVSSSGIPVASANRILRALRQAKRLKDLRPTSGNRPGVLCYPALLNIAEGAEVF